MTLLVANDNRFYCKTVLKNSKRKILWGILGAGEIADQFLASFPDNINGEVAAIASRSLLRAQSLATKYNIPTFYC